MLRTTLWMITMQYVSGIKKWNYEKLPLNFAMQFPFPFPVIPGNNNVSFPFPKCGNGISIPVPKNWEWNFPVPVPKSWEWNFSFPFPFPKFGNGLSHSRSRSQMTRSHSRSPLRWVRGGDPQKLFVFCKYHSSNVRVTATKVGHIVNAEVTFQLLMSSYEC